MDSVIGFYRAQDKYGCFSNFYRVSFCVNGIYYCNSEQYIMHQKALLFKDAEMAQKIIAETMPSVIKGYGRQVWGFDEKVWSDKVYDLTLPGLYEKFTQNPRIRDILLSTGDALIAECSPTDRIWGIGLPVGHPLVQDPDSWRGSNLLGRLLMDVRSEIRRAQ